MKTIETKKLKIGDWVLLKGENIKDGKFSIAKVELKKVELKDWETLDLKNGKIEIIGKGEFTGESGNVTLLNKKEIKAIEILRKKLKILNNLDDSSVDIKKRY